MNNRSFYERIAVHIPCCVSDGKNQYNATIVDMSDDGIHLILDTDVDKVNVKSLHYIFLETIVKICNIEDTEMNVSDSFSIEWIDKAKNMIGCAIRDNGKLSKLVQAIKTARYCKEMEDKA